MNKVWAAWRSHMHGLCTGVLHGGYAMGTRGSPDICTLGPWASGVYIGRAARAHGCALVICLICMPLALGLRACISGKSFMPMFQLLHKQYTNSWDAQPVFQYYNSYKE